MHKIVCFFFSVATYELNVKADLFISGYVSEDFF